MARFLFIMSFVCTALFTCAPAAFAQRLASMLTSTEVAVDSNFAGETLTIFGNIEPDIGASDTPVAGPFDVIIIIQGPSIDGTVRRKTGEFGIWLNTEQLTFRKTPSFFWTLSSQKLENIADETLLRQQGLLPETRPHLTVVQGNGAPDEFALQFVRLMTKEGLYGVDEHGVNFRSNTLYWAQIPLPANVPNGSFIAKTYLFKNGEIVSERAEGFSVRKTGLERFLGTTAMQWPWAYGLAAVILALVTGWLGGVIFKR